MVIIAQEGVDRSGWSNEDVSVLNAIIKDLWAVYDADDSRVYGTGFSAGGHWTCMLGLANADVFAAIGVQSGSMAFVLRDPGWADTVARPLPVDIHHGRSDPVVPFSEATNARDALQANGHVVGFTWE